MRLPRRLLLRPRLEQGGQPATTKKRVLFLLFVLALSAVFSTVYLLLATTGSRLVLEREYPLEARGLRQPAPVLPPSQVIPEVVVVDPPPPPPPITGPLLVTTHDPKPLELLQGSSIRIADTAVAPMPKVVAASAAAAAASAAAAAPAPPAPLLVIGIPTLRREGDPMYVVKTLEYLLNQTLGGLQGLQQGLGAGSDIPGPYPLRVRVLVMDNTRAPGTHAAFEACISQFLTQGVAAGVLPPRVTHSIPHPKDPTTLYTVDTSPSSLLAFAYNTRPRVEDGNDPGSDNVPGFRVRAQTRDVGDLLLLANALYGGSGGGGSGGGGMTAYMFLEDDFRVCPQGLASLALAMGVATQESTSGLPESGVRPWNAIRVSYGLNGGVLRGEDVGTLGEYLLQHTGRRPPDHMWVEWFAGETAQSAATKAGRPHVAFRYNLLEHFGFSSSLRAKASPLYAMCYQELNENVVFEVEAFKARACGHDVIWPCWHPGDPRYANVTPSGIDFETLAKEAVKDTVQTYALGGLPGGVWGTGPA